MAYAGLAHLPLLSWAFSSKYETLPAQAGFSPEQLDEALVRLRKIVSSQTYHLEPDVTVQNFADRIAVPPRLLSAAVNQRLGMSFRRYINDLRIEEAKHRLVSTDTPVLTIMFDVGFQTKSKFYAEFFAATSTSPGNFRKSARASSRAP